MLEPGNGDGVCIHRAFAVGADLFKVPTSNNYRTVLRDANAVTTLFVLVLARWRFEL